MDIKTTNVIRRVLREHRPIGQEGVPLMPDGTHPILCKCGEGGQSHWGNGMTYASWLDHVQVTLLDTEVPA
jgi:hypothetical protein